MWFADDLRLVSVLSAAAVCAVACSNEGSPSEIEIELVELERRPPGEVFVNPLVDGPAADPHMAFVDGEYFLLTTTSSVGAALRHAPTLSELEEQEPTVLWEAGTDETPCCHWWAPELHRLDGRYQIYISAGQHLLSQRMFVLDSDDALGPYQIRRIGPDVWSIDHSVLELPSGERYLVWSGHLPSSLDQGIFIARLTSPVEIEGEPVLISSPDEEWERRDGRGINEGPIALYGTGGIHLVYSASHSQTDHYCLGALALDPEGDPLNPASWTASDGCLFEQNSEAAAYGPGHGSFLRSPDGTELFNVYHAHETPSDGTDWPRRITRMQQMGFTTSGTPVFGRPVSLDAELAIPSGEPGSNRTRVEAEYGVMDDSIEVVWDREASSEQSAHVRAARLQFPRVDAGKEGSSALLVRYRADEEVFITLESEGASQRLQLPTTAGRYMAARLSKALPEGRHEIALRVESGELWVDALQTE